MKPSEIWLLIVDYKFQAVGGRFSVDTASGDDLKIHDLKTKVKENKPKVLSRVDPAGLTVWKTKGAMIIDNSTLERSAEILRSIDVDDEDTIEQLSEIEEVANLELSDGQTLLVQLPGRRLGRRLGDLITSEVNWKYYGILLQACFKGEITEEDIDSNGIKDVDWYGVPGFVEKHEKMLGRKRKVADNMRAEAETLIGEATCKEYFDYSTENFSLPISDVDQLEINHLCHISSVDGEKLWNTLNRGSRRLFSEDDANELFFYAIAHHIENLPSNTAGDGTAKITVNLGQTSLWPFPRIIHVKHDFYTYKPKSNFLILKSGLPRVAVAVNSNSHRPPEDHDRLILQGASVVRFANTFLDAYKKEKNFIFVAIFVSDTGWTDRYILYQREDSQNVYHKIRSFRFVDKNDRIRFALELHNLSSALNDESENEDTEGKVNGFMDAVYDFSRTLNLLTFTGGKSERPTRSGAGENQSRPNVRQKGYDGDAIKQLEACGYEVVPDVFEAEGGSWEMLSKLPPNIRTVYRRSDPNKTELIAKQVRGGSNELKILKYLHKIRPQSPHVISFIEIIPSATRKWLILPKLHSIYDQRLINSGGLRGRVKLGWGLVKGLAYLHEHKVAHRDVKPANLVRDDAFCLQIIDFDVAIKVRDENTEVDEFRGTRRWTAPEMGHRDGPTPMYSPIKADRWSCGRVLLRHIMVGKGNDRLSKFAGQLMANDPQQRPSLLEWHKWFAAPSFDGADVEVDRQSMRPPDAKKARLVVTERGV